MIIAIISAHVATAMAVLDVLALALAALALFVRGALELARLPSI